MPWRARTVVHFTCAGGRVARSLSAIRYAASWCNGMGEILAYGIVLLWLVLTVGSLSVLALALVRIARSKPEATVTGSIQARQTLRRWAVVAIVAGVLLLGAAGFAVFFYVSCIGEC